MQNITSQLNNNTITGQDYINNPSSVPISKWDREDLNLFLFVYCCCLKSPPYTDFDILHLGVYSYSTTT